MFFAKKFIAKLYSESSTNRKTIARITQHYFWPGMFREIARCVRNCEVCLRHKVAQQRPAPYTPPPYAAPGSM